MKVKYSVISGDIVSSSSLDSEDKQILETHLESLMDDLHEHFESYGRLIKGDYIECGIPNAANALRACLAIKSYVKTISISERSLSKNKKRARLFKEYGVRLAIGYGELERYDPINGVMDGEAIYYAGRKINSISTHDKERVVIQNTLFCHSKNEEMNKKWTAMLGLLDVLLNKATQRQCEVVYLKLMGHSEDVISKKLGIDQSVVNRHSTNVGWNAIESAVIYFEESLTL